MSEAAYDVLIERIERMDMAAHQRDAVTQDGLARVEAQVRLTNGRVTALERAQQYAAGVKATTSKTFAWVAGIASGVTVSAVGGIIVWWFTR